MEETKLQELYIKLITINNLLKELNQNDFCFTDQEFELIKSLIKK
jgi:hypothetical protein